MNTYIRQQIENMEVMIKAFKAGCEMAAIKDDGKTNKIEEKQLQKIRKAADRFTKELQKIREE